MRLDTDKLLRAIAAKGLNCVQFAKLCGLSKATIYKLISGDSCHRITCAKVALGANVPLKNLILKESSAPAQTNRIVLTNNSQNKP